MNKTVYLDHHATTPVDPRVLEIMLPFFSEQFGNASSRHHRYGWQAEEAVDLARVQVAAVIGTGARDIVFTSGATEANNLALFGVAESYSNKGKHLITQTTEHRAVLDPLAALQKRGWEVTTLAVDSNGLVDPDRVADAIRDDTTLVSVMMVNNEIGTVQPVAQIGAICKSRGVIFHTDATQAVGNLPVDVDALGVDLLSMSGHKLYGPKGVGALYMRRRDPRVVLTPRQLGGGHERGVRSGTLNVPGIVGLGAACELASTLNSADVARVRDHLQDALCEKINGAEVHAAGAPRHPGNLNVCFAGLEAEAVILGLRHVAVSSGAACASATLEPSHVLRAIGVSPEGANASIRFGVGRFNTVEEMDTVVEELVDVVGKVRDLTRSDSRTGTQ